MNLAMDRTEDAASQRASFAEELDVAVLVPCYNEETTIAKVVRDFRAALPNATVYVYDNNSKDRTIEEARAAGAVVRTERQQGKGAVVRRMFADIDADVFVMIDGDDTYDAASAPKLLAALVEDHLDMVNGAREHTHDDAYRSGHKFGNWMFSTVVRVIFGDQFKDMLSGYRVMSRRFVKSFPALSHGFEIETELTVHALRLKLPTAEIVTPYYARPEGSTSKLSTFRDGFRISRVISRMVRDEKPLAFFGFASVVLLAVAAVLIAPILVTYTQTGLVPRFPTLFGAVGLVIIAVLAFAVGLVLDTLSRARTEARRIAYLAFPSVGERKRSE